MKKKTKQTKLQELEKRITTLEIKRASENKERVTRTFYTHFNFPGHEFQVGFVNGAKVLQTESGWYIPWSDSARYVVEETK